MTSFRKCDGLGCCNFFSYDTWRQSKKKYCTKKCKAQHEYAALTDEQKQRRREQQMQNKRQRWAEMTDEDKAEANKYHRERWSRLPIEERRRVMQKNAENLNWENKRRYGKKWRRDKYRNNLEYRLTTLLRSRLTNAIKGTAKKSSAKQLIGCSIPQLRKHLEQQFKDGMTWDNHGDWHIDHIKPCAAFNLTNEDEQRECFHYSNLQPLWAIENMRKGAAWD
jgi:hypothetical protein